MIEKYGYVAVVHFEDTVQTLAGIFIGVIIGITIGAYALLKITCFKSIGEGKFKTIQITTDRGRHKYVVDLHGMGEAIQAILIIAFKKFFTHNSFSYRDERRTKIFLGVMCIVMILVIGLALLCISTIIEY